MSDSHSLDHYILPWPAGLPQPPPQGNRRQSPDCRHSQAFCGSQAGQSEAPKQQPQQQWRTRNPQRQRKSKNHEGGFIILAKGQLGWLSRPLPDPPLYSGATDRGRITGPKPWTLGVQAGQGQGQGWGWSCQKQASSNK